MTPTTPSADYVSAMLQKALADLRNNCTDEFLVKQVSGWINAALASPAAIGPETAALKSEYVEYLDWCVSTGKKSMLFGHFEKAWTPLAATTQPERAQEQPSERGEARDTAAGAVCMSAKASDDRYREGYSAGWAEGRASDRPWMHVKGKFLYVSRCDWIYPDATEDDAGPRDEERFNAIGRRDGDIVLGAPLIGSLDAQDLATMLAYRQPAATVQEQPSEQAWGKCVWCDAPSTTRNRSCSAPDGDGHLFDVAPAAQVSKADASELPPLPESVYLTETPVDAELHTRQQLIAYGDARALHEKRKAERAAPAITEPAPAADEFDPFLGRTPLQVGLRASTLDEQWHGTYQPLPTKSTSVTGSIGDDAEFQSCVDDIYTADGSKQRREATKRLAAYIDARPPVAPQGESK